MELNAATAGGGRIFFNCGRDPVTIPIGATGGVPLTLPDDTTIDGSGRITLVATTASGPSVSIDANAAVVLKNLNIVGGGGLFDAVVNSGSLIVWHCTFSGFSQGVIHSTGTLVITESTFSDNGSFIVSAVRIASGKGFVNRSVFTNNRAQFAGAIDNGGTLAVANSTFANNAADSFGGGGAIGNGGVLTIENTEFSGNVAGVGGALLNEGSLRVQGGTFANNQGLAGGGGAIFGAGTMILDNCDFLNNSVSGSGGSLYISGSVDIVDSSFSGNHAVGGDGGAIYTSADVLTIRRSLVITNTADRDGGGIFVAAGSLVQHQTTVAANTPNDIAGPQALSTAVLESGGKPGTVNEWLKSHILYGLTVSPDAAAEWRATLRQHLPLF
jgi:predicted outer membrane repeat protein